MTDILLVSELYPPAIGGSGELLANIYERLDGPSLTVLASRLQPAESARPHDPRVVRVLPSARHWGLVHPQGALNHLKCLRQIRRLSSPRSTVVHCGRALPEGLSAWVNHRLGGSPYLCWAHGEELGYAAASRELGRLMTLVYRGATEVLANSRNTASLVATCGVDSSRITVVYPGVDTDRFRPDVPGRSAVRRELARDDETLLVTVGRLQRRKGHDLCLRALGLLRDRYPRIRYAVVGDGPERAALEQLTDQLGVRNQVTFVGAVDADRLGAYFAAADVFVHPNRVDGRDFEGFGIVFLEAAASGVPVIAGRSGGAPEAVEEDVTGQLVSGTDAGELARSIERLVVDAGLRSRLGAAGRERVLRSFTWARAAALVRSAHERAVRARSTDA